MERLELATPIVPPTTSAWHIARLDLHWAAAEIEISLLADSGRRLTHRYSGNEATAMMVSLNKMNLTVKSLQRRVLERLVADGVLDGTLTGTPD